MSDELRINADKAETLLAALTAACGNRHCAEAAMEVIAPELVRLGEVLVQAYRIVLAQCGDDDEITGILDEFYEPVRRPPSVPGGTLK